jgi:hypothetical protein
MCPDDNTRVPDDATSESDASLQSEIMQKSGSRRAFLKAAALGTAAAAVLGRGGSGLRLGARSASADVLTNVNCTANDVRIIGPGIIVDEPCDCDEDFTATVQFTVNNNTGTDRYCVTVHLCEAELPGGGTIGPMDLVVGTVPPGIHQRSVTIPNYPCGAGLVCFGAAGSGEDGGFAKGETCPTGECCTIISWNVRANDGCPQDHDDIIKSKCRAQQVCIQGRAATLECIDNCEPTCGGTATLEMCVEGGEAPFTFVLSRDDGGADQTFGPTNDTCHSFEVTVTETTTFTGTVTDSGSPPCADDTNEVTLNVTPVDAPDFTFSEPDCDGNVTLTVVDCDTSLDYTFTEINCATDAVIGTLGTGCEITVPLDDGDHCIVLRAENDAGCFAETEKTVPGFPGLATVTLDYDQVDCGGVLTFTAEASGGEGPFEFTFAVDGSPVQSGTSNTFSYGPNLDGQCHTVSCAIEDTGTGCPGSNIASKDVSQCVVTTDC